MSVSMQPNEATSIEMKEKISLTFGVRYLNCFSKAYTLSDQVTIKLSFKLPTVFEYKIREVGYIRYYVMPAEIKAETQWIAEEDKMQN
jgi:proliferating cell nuclear antigen